MAISRQTGGLEIVGPNPIALTMRTKNQERLTKAIFSIVQLHEADKHIAKIALYRDSNMGSFNYIQIDKKKEPGRSTIMVRHDCTVAIQYPEGRIMAYPKIKEEWRQEDPNLFGRIEKLIAPVV